MVRGIGVETSTMREFSGQLSRLSHDLVTRARQLRDLTHTVGQQDLLAGAAASGAFSLDYRRAAQLAHVEEASFGLEHLATRAQNLADQLESATVRSEQAEFDAWHEFQRYLEHPTLGLSSPRAVAAIRALAAHADLSFAALSGGLVGFIVQAGRDRRGPERVASLGAAVIELMTPKTDSVSVRRMTSQRTTAPLTLAELATRIPSVGTDGAQVRIERYEIRGGASWIVYCAGTATMKPHGGAEPWDMKSNLDAMSGESADSTAAVTRAMALAGVTQGDHVLYVGFSQGGMIAAQLAADAKPGTADVVTFGAPIAQLDLASVDGVVTVEHAEDLVPALSGAPSTGAEDRVSIVRPAFDDVPEESGLPAHNLERYERTTQLAEASPDRALRAEKQSILSHFTGSGTSSLWKASRKTEDGN